MTRWVPRPSWAIATIVFMLLLPVACSNAATKQSTPTAVPPATATVEVATPVVTPSSTPNATLVATVTAQPSATVSGTTVTPTPGMVWAPTPIPTLSSGQSPTELKYQLLAAYPGLFFCDPDYYPVARSDEAQLADQRFPQLQANQEEFTAIVGQLGLSGTTTFSDTQKLTIYREHKRLAAIQFQLAGSGYDFQFQIKDNTGQGFLLSGHIDGSGSVSGLKRQASVATCPICLAAQTLIDTPNGAVPVSSLKVGDLVWTLNSAGQRVAMPLLQTGHVPVPTGHEMVHLVLSDGRELLASLGHPTADGRRLAEIQAGDALEGAVVLNASRELYGQPYTYDILPAGDTGFYWANGVLLASTLR